MRSEAPHASRVHEADSLLLPSFGVDHSCFPALARYGVAVAGLSGSGTGVGSGVAVGTGVGGTPGVGGGGGVAKIPSGSRSRRYISQCPSGSEKQTHTHFLGKQRGRCCGFAATTAGAQAAASFSASVIVVPSQSQQLSGVGVALGKQSIDDVSGSKHDSGIDVASRTGITSGSATTAGLGSAVGFSS